MDTRDTGRGLEGVLLDMSPEMRSWIAFAFISRSDMPLEGGSTGVCEPFMDMERLDDEGEGGGGMAISLGILGRGVLPKEGRDFEGVVDVGRPMPIPDGRVGPRGFGVLKGDPMLRVGEPS